MRHEQDPKPRVRLGERLRRERLKREVSRETLALAWEVSVSTIRNWEVGLSEPRPPMEEAIWRWLKNGSGK